MRRNLARSGAKPASLLTNIPGALALSVSIWDSGSGEVGFDVEANLEQPLPGKMDMGHLDVADHAGSNEQVPEFSGGKNQVRADAALDREGVRIW